MGTTRGEKIKFPREVLEASAQGRRRYDGQVRAETPADQSIVPARQASLSLGHEEQVKVLGETPTVCGEDPRDTDVVVVRGLGVRFRVGMRIGPCGWPVRRAKDRATGGKQGRYTASPNAATSRTSHSTCPFDTSLVSCRWLAARTRHPHTSIPMVGGVSALSSRGAFCEGPGRRVGAISSTRRCG